LTPPGGKFLVAALQSATRQDGGTSPATRRYSRLLYYDVADRERPRLVREYVVPLPGLPMMMRAAMEQVAAQLAERGEPWKSFFEPQALAGVGVMFYVLLAVRADAAVVTEPTEMAVVVAHKGFVWSEVEVSGRAAHGSRPHLGVDAIVKTGPILTALGVGGLAVALALVVAFHAAGCCLIRNHWPRSVALVTASAFSLPARIWPSSTGTSKIPICTCPPSRSFTAGAAPLYGTCTRSTFASALSSSTRAFNHCSRVPVVCVCIVFLLSCLSLCCSLPTS